MRLARTWYALACSSALACTSSNTGTAPKVDAGTRNACPRNGIVPPTLRDVERDAEGVSYSAFGEYPTRMADFPRTKAVLALLHGVWDSAKKECPGLPKSAVAGVDKALDNLDAAVPAKDQAAAARAGNDVHLQMAPLFEYFHPDIPIEVVRMDATFLRAGLDAHFDDWTAFDKDVASLESDWKALRATAAKKVPTCHRVAGTGTVVGDVDDSLANMKKASSAMDKAPAEMEADAGLLEVDILELLFDCPPDATTPKSGIGAKCKTDKDCESGEVCDKDNRGGICSPDPTTTNVGITCTTTIDCGNDPRDACNTEAGDLFPGGYCIMEPCDDVQVCSAGATCVALPFETPACFLSCKADADCRDGYVCQLFPTVAPSGFGPSDHACAFACKKDEDCTMPLKCQIKSGKCTP